MSLETPKQSTIAQAPARQNRERKRGGAAGSNGNINGGSFNFIESSGGSGGNKGGNEIGGEINEGILLNERKNEDMAGVNNQSDTSNPSTNANSNSNSLSPRTGPSSPSPRSQDNIYFRREGSNASKISGSVIASRRSRMKRDSLPSGTTSTHSSRGASLRGGPSQHTTTTSTSSPSGISGSESHLDDRNHTLRSSHSQNPSVWYNPALTHSPRDNVTKDLTLKSVKDRPSNVEKPKKPSSRHSLLHEDDMTTPKASRTPPPPPSSSSLHNSPPTDTQHEDDSPHSDGSTGSTNSGGSPEIGQQGSSHLPRPGASKKSRPTSHKKRARPKPSQPPPTTNPETENSNFENSPAQPQPQIRKGALGSKSKSQYKKNEGASKSFLGSSFLNMSFLLPKSNSSANLSDKGGVGTTSGIGSTSVVGSTSTGNAPHPTVTRGNSVIAVDKYPTNENSLARMSSYAVLPSVDSYTSLTLGVGVGGEQINSQLHPAAAGLNTNKLIRHSSVLQLEKLKFSQNLKNETVDDQKNEKNEKKTEKKMDKNILETEKRDFSRFYRQGSSQNSNSFAEESAFFRIANFALDCGPSLDQKILSYSHAQHVAAFLHPGYLDEEGNQFDHPLSSDFGWFDYPFKNILTRQKSTESNVLERYGVGISLWFKFLKAFSVIFFVMFLITSPSLIFFIRGSNTNMEQREAVTSSPSDALFMTTLGNLGTTQNLCFTVQPDSEVHLNCQGTITAISVYYGQPNGSCTCPVPQQPTLAGECPGKIVKDGCSKDMYGRAEACYYSSYELGYDDPQPCCAYNEVNGEPSLEELKINPNYDCNSLTAQYIAEGMCLGQSSCTLTASDSHLYSWRGLYAKNLATNVCKSSTKSRTNLMMNECNTTLTHLGIWSGCPLTETSSRYLQIQAVCSPEKIETSVTSMSKSSVVVLASVLNALAILVFTFGVYWIAIQQKNEEAVMDRNTCRAKDFTVCVTKIPPVYASTQELAKKLKRHFEKVLSSAKPCFLPGSVRVVDINFTTGSYTVLQTAINRGDAARELDALLYKKSVLEYLGRQKSWIYSYLEWREKKWIKTYEYWNDKCLRGNTETSKHVKRAYVTFESEEGYNRCLRVFSSNSFKHYFDNSEYLLEGKEIVTMPAEDPSDILWENLGTPRLEKTLRRWLTNILLIALIVLTYIAVDAATTTTREMEQGYPTTINCDDYKVDLNRSNVDQSIASVINYESVLRDVEWQYYNNTYGRQGFLNCFCREIYLQDGLKSMLNYEFEDPEDHSQEHWCKQITYGFLKVTLLRIVVAIVVVAVNVSAKSILRGLKDFEQRSSHSAISTSMTFKLFLVQVVNAGLLILLMNGYIHEVNNQSNIAFLNGKYDDFTIDWYGDVGKSLIGTMILYMFGVHGLKFALLLFMKFQRWQDTHFTNDTRLTYQVSQEQLNRLYIGPEFVIEVRYATVLTICFVCITYASSMPIMYLIASLSFILHYWIDKYFFLRVNRIPRAVSPTLALHVTRMFYFAGFINLCVAIWTFSNEGIFNPTVTAHHILITPPTSSLTFVEVHLKYIHFSSFYERLFNQYTIASWLGLAPLILGVVVFISHSLIKAYGHQFNFCNRYFSHLLQNESVYEGNPEYFDSIPLYLLRRRVEDGIVKKHILERYKSRIKELEGQTQKVTKQLEGLESYDIGLNEIYADKFALNSDYILRRRPPDLFHAECKDEESGLLEGNETQLPSQRSPHRQSSPTSPLQQNIPFRNFNSPVKNNSPRHSQPHSPTHKNNPSPSSPRPSSAQPPPRPTPTSPPNQQQQQRSQQQPSSATATSPRKETSPRGRPSLEHIPSACSILNDDVVAEIKDVAELF